MPEVYIYYLQNPPVAPFLVLQTRVPPADLAETVRAELRALDKDMTVYDLRTMSEIRAASVAERRFVMLLTVGFGVLALVLAAVGVYGVMALVVSERTREIAIRMILGAQPRGVLRRVVGQGVALAAAGVGIGVVAALALTPLMAGQLYGVGTADPLTLVAVPLLLVATALAACAVPARRATRVDPQVALRSE
jgi:putative ABC transport system permease protein